MDYGTILGTAIVTAGGAVGVWFTFLRDSKKDRANAVQEGNANLHKSESEFRENLLKRIDTQDGVIEKQSKEILGIRKLHRECEEEGIASTYKHALERKKLIEEQMTMFEELIKVRKRITELENKLP